MVQSLDRLEAPEFRAVRKGDGFHGAMGCCSAADRVMKNNKNGTRLLASDIQQEYSEEEKKVGFSSTRASGMDNVWEVSAGRWGNWFRLNHC